MSEYSEYRFMAIEDRLMNAEAKILELDERLKKIEDKLPTNAQVSKDQE